MDPLKMYVLLKSGDIPASYVSLPEGKCMVSELQNCWVIFTDLGEDGNIQVWYENIQVWCIFLAKIRLVVQ